MPTDDQNIATTGISRRSAIKKGAIAGGALMWATPIVQTLGQGVAGAQTEGSPRCEATASADAIQISSSGGTGQIKSFVAQVSGGCGDCPPGDQVVIWSVVTDTNFKTSGTAASNAAVTLGPDAAEPTLFRAEIEDCNVTASITLTVRVEQHCPGGTCAANERTEKFDFVKTATLTSCQANPGDGALVSDVDVAC